MKLFTGIISFFKEKKAKTKTGFIKFFNRRKGYGFIRSQETTKDVFVHVTDLEDRVKVGDQVQFELEFNSRGMKAKNVALVES